VPHASLSACVAIRAARAAFAIFVRLRAMLPVERRPLHRLERAVAYGLLGLSTEVAFTAVQGLLLERVDDRVRELSERPTRTHPS